MDPHLVSGSWDAEYRRGRYADDPPLPFVADIVSALADHPVARRGTGLYVGCGNGRNYLPLVDAGLRPIGLDVSPEALRQLIARRPGVALPLVCGDFRSLADRPALDYLVAIQVFQHGTAADAATYFRRTAALLRPGGLFFLRVNSAATDVLHAHSVIEARGGGRTVLYHAGPKQGLPVHFFDRQELHELTTSRFDSVVAPREATTLRHAPATGSWTQWEAIWRRR
ncbi:MAG: class I SAM-dependent methyltransferase [Candidatus Rokubacteria bacterium]|nr:class I SAM-dependent methyltransferase [Candidatus Rokubacteria bacterium]